MHAAAAFLLCMPQICCVINISQRSTSGGSDAMFVAQTDRVQLWTQQAVFFDRMSA